VDEPEPARVDRLTRRIATALWALLLASTPLASAAPASNVGYRTLDVHDTLTGERFPVALWYPTRAEPAPLFVNASLSPCRLPTRLCRLIAFEMPVAAAAPPGDGAFGLIVISHGAGGLALNHRDLALALAARGYVAAAPAHPRGTGNDISGDAVWIGRPKQVSRVIDAVLDDAALGPRVQRGRIGVVGHSNGGYTALAVAGAPPTPRAMLNHCVRHPDDVRFCAFGGAATREATATARPVPDVRDVRVRAIVLLAPNALPFTDEALGKVTVPVRLYAAERDDLTLVRYHAERLARALPPGREYVVIRGAGHFSFVAGFPTLLKLIAGEAARDPDGFDREALHETMNPEIAGFFDRTLPAGRGR